MNHHMSFDYANESGADIAEDTGQHLHESDLDFDAWAYLRPGSGFTVVVKQVPPQPMVEAADGDTLPFRYRTINVAAGRTTLMERAETEADARRVDFNDLPDEVQGAVFAAASTGWVWSGVEHHYDPGEGWVRSNDD